MFERKKIQREPTTYQDTGRSKYGKSGDKYSDETPRKDYEDYRKDNPADKSARRDKENLDFSHKGPRSIDVVKQEFKAHIQNFRENFNSAQYDVWDNKLDQLREELKRFRR